MGAGSGMSNEMMLCLRVLTAAILDAWRESPRDRFRGKAVGWAGQGRGFSRRRTPNFTEVRDFYFIFNSLIFGLLASHITVLSGSSSHRLY